MKHVLLGLVCLCLLVACKAIPPGHDHNGPGNSENAPGHNKHNKYHPHDGKPGNSENAPGQQNK